MKTKKSVKKSAKKEVTENKNLKMSYVAQQLILSHELTNKLNKTAKISKNRVKDFNVPKTIDAKGKINSTKLVTDSGVVFDENFSLPLNGYCDEIGKLAKINEEVINSWFLGYGQYSILTQSGIMQRIIQAYALEATRCGFKVKSKNKNNSSRDANTINKIEKRLKELKVQEKLKHAAEMMCAFGGGFIYPKIKGDESVDGGSEMQTPLYKEKIGKGDLEELRMIEPLYCTPNAFNANNPLLANFYKPQTWTVLGNIVHESRLLHFKYNEVPTLLKPVYLFNGMPLTQLCLDHVYGYENVRHNIIDITQRYNINIFKTDLNALIRGDGDGDCGDSVIDRLKLANAIRDNFSIFALNNDPAAPEEWQQFTMAMSGFSEILSQNAELVCAVACAPAIIVFGTSPKGFNSTGDIELRIWYDRVGSFQENNLQTQLNQIFEYAQLDLFGDISDDLIIEFNPLWKPSELERSQIRLNRMQESAGYVESGILLVEEVRQELAQDSDSGYNSLLSDEEYRKAVEDTQLDDTLYQDEGSDEESSESSKK